VDRDLHAHYASVTCVGHFSLLFSVDHVLGTVSSKALWHAVKVEERSFDTAFVRNYTAAASAI
jgi:hypothetical protein